MTPADGSNHPFSERVWHLLPDAQAILLHGGRAILLFESSPVPIPETGRIIDGTSQAHWVAKCWDAGGGGHSGLAILDFLPGDGSEIHDDLTARAWRFNRNSKVDVCPQPLADLARGAGIDCREIFDFLVERLIKGRPECDAEKTAYQNFTRDFLGVAAERDGFVELMAAPDGGGVFAQGWSLSLSEGEAVFASAADGLSLRSATVAAFERDDILPPGKGFCLFGKDWPSMEIGTVDAIYHESGGRLLRLDVVANAGMKLGQDSVVPHVESMLDQLQGDENIVRAFRRICRPRFDGTDTLSGCDQPVAAALDTLLIAPNGSILAIGWLLDPTHQVDRVILKSRGGIYAPLDPTWCPLPRPDLNEGYGSDARFHEVLNPDQIMHGFIVHVPPGTHSAQEDNAYLELVLSDDTCLFKPVTLTEFRSADRLPAIVGSLSAEEPELARIVEEHLAPFLENVRPADHRTYPNRDTRLIPLGGRHAKNPVSVIMPFCGLPELQPVFGLLAGSQESTVIELALVTSRTVAKTNMQDLESAFRFYGLQGGLVITPDGCTVAGQLDAGVAATNGETVLCWTPAVLPKAPGWLAELSAEMDRLPGPGLLSPALTYEDDSIYFGGDRLDLPDPDPVCSLSGYSADWLERGTPEPVASGAAEIAMIPRDTLVRAGGFAGQVFSDCYAHMDLARRLRRHGSGAYCAGAVEFWMLDDARPGEDTPFVRIMQKVDAALLSRRASRQAQDGGTAV